MGFFKKVGRQVEQFKQTATETAAEDAPLQCQVCDERVYTHHDECPECGATSLTVPTTE